ncbi:hypothetical protein E9531_02385 [Lampropedia puyangensis]|uniref:Heme biosynthesis operon protein HemX n=1 Tax=Lampropedia puyangensis TaxID=1330072 RepID=A0A4S8FDM2_9BURK|nr:uroporphyrinogen-III C-methyltransferase [Lampropedia puyangensis]THU05407.1 hypothetical protein E9531_02385 [Lampropedia puyangensis]
MLFPIWGAWLLVAIAVLGLLLAYSQWRRLNHIQTQLGVQTTQIQAQAIEAKTLSEQAQALARDASTRSSLSEARVNEYTLQRSHIEQMAFELSRTRDETMLIDMEASLRLSQQQAQLTGLADPLVAALRNAAQRLDRAEQPRLTPIRSAIEQDLSRLTSAAVTDTAGLLGRIDTLLLQLEQIPLANAVGGTSSAQNAPSPAIETAPTDSESASNISVPPDNVEATPLPDDRNTVAVQADDRGWLGVLFDNFSSLVRVQRIDYPEAALLTAEQAFFLRENMRLQLMNARMGLLARQSSSARADLASAQALLLKYFDLTSARTQQALRTLQQLQNHILSVQAPAITDTLNAIAAAHAVRQVTTQPANTTNAASVVGGNSANTGTSAAINTPAAASQERD